MMNWNPAQLEVAALSETGYVRDENQDRMSGTVVARGHLFIVADGMGGHKGGALAAELTVEGLHHYLGEAPADAPVEQAIRSAFHKVNRAVHEKAHSGDPATEGMGSTAVLVLIADRIARFAHVGDSRAYLFRDGRLTQLTTDHTIVQKMVEAGMLSAEEAADHPSSSILDRAIGARPTVKVDTSEVLQLKHGDGILLCSDGLSGYVAHAAIECVLRSEATVQQIPERLVGLALEKGGKDNVSVQYIQYGERKMVPSCVEGTEETSCRSSSLHKVVAFILGLALSVYASSLYIAWKLNVQQQQLQKVQSKAEDSAVEADKLREQLREVEHERDAAKRQAAKCQQ